MNKALAFILNLPWTIIGLAAAIISAPVSMRFHAQPMRLIFNVRSFWWKTWLPAAKGTRATTSGDVVLIGKNSLPKDLEHELVHVAQYEREPFIHPFLYMRQSLRHGYRKNVYEQEAYEKAGNVYIDKKWQ